MILTKMRCVLHSNDFPSQIFKDCEGLFVVKEKEVENPHFHLVFSTTLKVSGIRNRIQKSGLFNNKGAYSLSKGFDEGYIRYMCKGDRKGSYPIVIRNDTMVDVSTMHTLYYQFNDAIKKSIKDKSIDLMSIYKEYCIKNNKKNTDCNQIIENVSDFYFWYSKEYSKSFSPHIVESFSWRVLAHYESSDALVRLKSKLISKYML